MQAEAGNGTKCSNIAIKLQKGGGFMARYYLRDPYGEQPPIPVKGMSRKRRGMEKEKRRMKEIYDQNNGWICPVGWSKTDIWRDENGFWHHAPAEGAYLERYWRGSRSPYLKQQAAKAVRRCKHGISGKGGYKKVYDLWWEMW